MFDKNHIFNDKWRNHLSLRIESKKTLATILFFKLLHTITDVIVLENEYFRYVPYLLPEKCIPQPANPKNKNFVQSCQKTDQ